jgi:hypothetical protein
MEVLTLILIFIIVLFASLLFAWLYANYKRNDVSNFNITKLIEGQQDATEYVKVDKSKIPLSAQGNEYSMSFWLFIKDYNYRYGSRKAVLYRGDKENENSNPYIYFEPKNNDLTVRVQLQSGTVNKKESNRNNTNTSEQFRVSMPLDYFNPMKSNVSGNEVMVENFNPTTTPTPTTSSSTPAPVGNVNDRLDRIELQLQKLAMVDKTAPTPSGTNDREQDQEQPNMYDECTLEDIPIQKWVHIVVSIYNNNIEIYMDGRLHKSCSLSGYPKPNLYNMHVTPNGGFNGFIAQLDYSNAALPVNEIYKIYRRGPKLQKTFMEKVSEYGTGVSNVITE